MQIMTLARKTKRGASVRSYVYQPMTLHCPIGFDFLLFLNPVRMGVRQRADVGEIKDYGPLYLEESVHSAGVPWGKSV